MPCAGSTRKPTSFRRRAKYARFFSSSFPRPLPARRTPPRHASNADAPEYECIISCKAPAAARSQLCLSRASKPRQRYSALLPGELLRHCEAQASSPHDHVCAPGLCACMAEADAHV